MAKEDKKAPEAAPKPKKKMLLLVVAALLVLGLGGGGAWYFLKGNKHGAAEQKPAANLSAQPIFVPLDTFTVNLQHEQGDQVLQVGLSLKLYNQDLNDKIKNAMPEIRSNLLLLLSSKHASELITVAGKKKLAREIIVSVNSILGIHTVMAHPKVEVASAPAPAGGPATPAADAAAQPAPAAPQAAATPEGTAAAPAAAGTAVAAAPTPAPAPAVPAQADIVENRDGIVDVLFTSFIIQ
ncbi:MAG: flagellar basal body-associated protein FliL [Betaproteobacteria bacterium]|nr:flagellar basal body-associated protein FliL [Betaproteobacteria bacterium]